MPMKRCRTVSYDPPVTICQPDPRLTSWPYAPDGAEERWSPHKIFAGLPPLSVEDSKFSLFSGASTNNPEPKPGERCKHFFRPLPDGSFKCRHCGTITSLTGRRVYPKRTEK